ncbi:ATP-dependent RNA helicase SrmB [Candidatus Lokiarchaeum ossiferum]|uniref:ATP-dependent RNA helicase SrmB n=1 Tax=Candidatus Lokiarchaeum ossiferum TaxID=2951803 RepID=A0ABY6HYP5_9ARCH|nr:ATP-dependent RNA helicase SrmB [Candidatus Lokiarchaeum sp. B-35]
MIQQALTPTNPKTKLHSQFIPYLKNEKINPREYQIKISDRAFKENLMVVIPTGLGKTFIGTLTMLHFLTNPSYPNPTIIFLAPTRPLINQHYQSHIEILDTEKISLLQLTGQIKPTKRQEVFQLKIGKILFMTPQTLRNDLENKLYTLSKVDLIIFDEAHRASGNYAYCSIADHYVKENIQGRIMALTASPGSSNKKQLEIMENLHISKNNIEFRDLKHAEVQQYTFDKEEIDIGVQMSPFMMKVHSSLVELKNHTVAGYMELLLNYDSSAPTNPNLYHLGFCADKMKSLPSALKKEGVNERELRILISTNARLMKILKLINDLESQGLEVVLNTLEKMYEKIQKGKASMADRFLSSEIQISQIYQALQIEKYQNPKLLEHPKIIQLRSILKSQFEDNSSSRILIFVKLRATIKSILKKIRSIPHCRPQKFVGQASKKGDEGLKQKDQIKLTNDFKSGKYNVLIATNVAEEGLDIAECNVVVFFDNSASVIQLIQRAGRTGRSGKGKVIYLYTIGTSDERNHLIAKRKKDQFKKKFEIKPVLDSKIKAKQVSKKLNGKLPILYSKEITSLSEVKENKIRSNKTHSIQISPEVNDLYELESSLSLNFGLILKSSEFDIYISAKKVKIGFDILNASEIEIDANNFLFLKSIKNKQISVNKYLIFLDISNILPEEQKLLAQRVKEFRDLLQINLVLFKDIATLHIKIRTILKKFAKDHF